MHRRMEVHTNRRTYRQTKGRGSNFKCQLSHVSSMQCTTMQPSSILQFSTAVCWLTKKYKNLFWPPEVEVLEWGKHTDTQNNAQT